VTGYHPMTLADLAGRLARAADGKVRWKLVWEFLEEYRWEPEDVQPSLLHDEPSSVGDERWDTLLPHELTVGRTSSLQAAHSYPSEPAAPGPSHAAASPAACSTAMDIALDGLPPTANL
jgi:hypothetical protein